MFPLSMGSIVFSTFSLFSFWNPYWPSRFFLQFINPSVLFLCSDLISLIMPFEYLHFQRSHLLHQLVTRAFSSFSDLLHLEMRSFPIQTALGFLGWGETLAGSVTFVFMWAPSWITMVLVKFQYPEGSFILNSWFPGWLEGAMDL